MRELQWQLDLQRCIIDRTLKYWRGQIYRSICSVDRTSYSDLVEVSGLVREEVIRNSDPSIFNSLPPEADLYDN